jgi:hypothetical protein
MSNLKALRMASVNFMTTMKPCTATDLDVAKQFDLILNREDKKNEMNSLLELRKVRLIEINVKF